MFTFHALTDVAIDYRPFGPEIPESAPMSTS
jgi:hypothetical protein